MAGIDISFNHPNDPINLSRLFNDAREAKSRLAIVAAWLTDTELVEAFVQSQATAKIVILNRADTTRGSRKAVQVITAYMNERLDGTRKKQVELNRRTLEIAKQNEGWKSFTSNKEEHNRFMAIYEQSGKAAQMELGITDIDLVVSTRMAIIGGSDWQSGVMHHKFIVADNVSWFGSFNFTFNARNNYETLARLVNGKKATEFWTEAEKMTWDEEAWTDMKFGNTGGTIFRCGICLKLFPHSKQRYYESNGICCDKCLEKIP